MSNRRSRGQPITLIHGDCHTWNIMFPKDPDRHGAIYIDWELWKHDVGAFDLAYMIVLHWEPERRKRFEKDLLKRYHDTLLSKISSEYSWDKFETDYRLGPLSIGSAYPCGRGKMAYTQAYGGHTLNVCFWDLMTWVVLRCCRGVKQQGPVKEKLKILCLKVDI